MESLKIIIEKVKLPSDLKREHAATIITIATATALLISYIKSVSKTPEIPGLKEIPSPKERYPYVGHLFSLTKTPGRKVTHWHKELGPIFQLKMGIETWIMIDDPALVHKVLVTNGADTSYRQKTLWTHKYYGMNGLGVVFPQPDAVWKKGRSAALSLLAPKQVGKYRDLIHTESVELAQRLMKATEEYGSVNPQPDLMLSSFNVIYQVGFGKRFKSIEESEYKKLAGWIDQAMEYTSPEYNLSNMLPALKFLDYFSGHEANMKKFAETVRNPVMRELISGALTKEGQNVTKSLFDESIGMTEDEALCFMSDFIVAGTDTISVTLTWTFAILSYYPDVQRRVCEEIDAFVQAHKRLPAFEERDQLPYCIAVMKECMRFRPTTPLGIGHTTDKDLIIDDYFFPKGALIFSSMESMHQRVGGHYPDADKFMPERFLDNTRTMQSAANGRFEERDHFNFGWGRRICAGIYLAETEMLSAFVELFSQCIIDPVSESERPDIDTLFSASIACLPLPYKLKFVRRANSLV